MTRTTALIAFLIAAIVADVAIVGAIKAIAKLSSAWLSFLRAGFGALIGMYGPTLFARIGPKKRRSGTWA